MPIFKHLSAIAQDNNPDVARAKTVVYGLYRGFLGRDPEPDGLKHWTGRIMAGDRSDTVLNAILASEEYRLQVLQQKPQAARSRLIREISARAGPLLAARPLTIVDVGAQDLPGEPHIYAPLCGAGLPCGVIGFEPLQEKLEARRLGNPDPSIRLLPTFIGDGGTHVFHINSPDTTSSLLPFNADLISQLADLSPFFTERTEVVSTRTLDEVLGDTAHVDFLKLDIQGFELPVLQNAGRVLARTNVIHCEVSFAEMYRGQAMFSEVEAFLRTQGFHFIDFSFLCSYPYHCRSGGNSRDRLGWADAVFFKDSELSSGTDLLVQALIASLVYDKDTFAEMLMERQTRPS